MLDRDVGGGRIGASRASDQTKDFPNRHVAWVSATSQRRMRSAI
jgi:hypothetical protein